MIVKAYDRRGAPFCAGYRVETTFFPNGGKPFELQPAIVNSKKPEKVVKNSGRSKTIFYYNLEIAADWRDQECPYCRYCPNDIVPMRTNIGIMDVVVCEDCGKIFRPAQ